MGNKLFNRSGLSVTYHECPVCRGGMIDFPGFERCPGCEGRGMLANPEEAFGKALIALAKRNEELSQIIKQLEQGRQE